MDAELLRGLVAKWRARAASHGRASQSEYDHEAGAGDTFDFCADKLEAALSVAQGQGFVMVPQDPTPEMIEAGILFGTSPNKACIIYQSMVNAAPAQPDGVGK